VCITYSCLLFSSEKKAEWELPDVLGVINVKYISGDCVSRRTAVLGVKLLYISDWHVIYFVLQKSLFLNKGTSV
jgi:hypothetical protein